jgi:glycogen(starch) synthase
MHCVYFPPEVGGLESHVYHLARALAGRGHSVAVVTSLSRAGAPAHELLEGVEVWRTWFPARNPAGWIAATLGAIPRMLKVARDADVVHAQDFPSVVPAAAARRASGAPLVTTHHTSHFLKRARLRRWRPVLARLVRAADHNLAASREIADVAESLAPGVRVEALTNGVDTERFRPVEPTLGAVGAAGQGEGRSAVRRIVVPRRLYEKNGVEHLVRAVPIMAAELPRIEVAVVGDGPERPRLEALATELGVADRVRFLGARPHREMPGLLCSGEVAVFPSLMEATSVAALECMACGVPVAASRVGGLPEIVDASVGALFEPADPESLARAVTGLLCDAGLAGMGARARKRVVARWSNERLAERHLEIYEALVAGRPVPPPAPATGRTEAPETVPE